MPSDPHHFTSYIEGSRCKHGTEDTNDHIEARIAQSLKVRSVPFLKSQVFKPGCGGPHIAGFDEVCGNVDPIYSDSRNAISWVYTGKCKTQLKHTPRNAPLFAIIHSAENWLAENELRDDAVLKWDTEMWGENPADFGRK